jgi:arsenate reductase
MMMTTTTIYHNPNCGTSRTVLALLQDAGMKPRVIEYLKTPPSRQELAEIQHAIGLPVREIMRRSDALYGELELDHARWTEAQLLDLIAQHPILLNRPIVVTAKGARLCRPAEMVRELLG